MRSIEAVQKSWIALYDKYTDGKLERMFSLNDNMMLIWRSWKENLQHSSRHRKKRKMSTQAPKGKTDQAMVFLEEEKLIENMKEMLIEKVISYP